MASREHPNARYARVLPEPGLVDVLRRERQLRLAAESANEREDLLGAGKDVLEALIGPLGTWDAAQLIAIDPATGRAVSAAWAFHHVDGGRIFAPLVAVGARASDAPWAPGQPAATVRVHWSRIGRCPSNALNKAAGRCGVGTRVDIPVTTGTDIAATIRVYSLHDREPDSEVVATLAAMGTILGRTVERTRAFQAKQEAAARQLALTASSPLATISVDPQLRVTGWNAAARDLFGWTEQEMRGQGLGRLFPPELAEEYAAGLEAVASGTAPTQGRNVPVTGLHKDGATVEGEAFVGIWYERTGRHFAIFVEDVADRHRAEAAVRERDVAQLSVQHALELQDNVIQGLVVAKYALEGEDAAEALEAVSNVLAAAQSMVGQMMSQTPVEQLPDALMRSQPADGGPTQVPRS